MSRKIRIYLAEPGDEEPWEIDIECQTRNEAFFRAGFKFGRQYPELDIDEYNFVVFDK